MTPWRWLPSLAKPGGGRGCAPTRIGTLQTKSSSRRRPVCLQPSLTMGGPQTRELLRDGRVRSAQDGGRGPRLRQGFFQAGPVSVLDARLAHGVRTALGATGLRPTQTRGQSPLLVSVYRSSFADMPCRSSLSRIARRLQGAIATTALQGAMPWSLRAVQYTIDSLRALSV